MKKFWIIFVSLLLCAVIGVGIWHGIAYGDKIKVFAEEAWSKIESVFKKDEVSQDDQDKTNPDVEDKVQDDNPGDGQLDDGKSEDKGEELPGYYGVWGRYVSEDELEMYHFGKNFIMDFDGFVKDEVVYIKDFQSTSGYAAVAELNEETQTIKFVWGKTVEEEFVYDIAQEEMSLADGTKLIKFENYVSHTTDFSCDYEWTVVSEGNCLENGEKHGVCSICGHEKDVSVKGNHAYEPVLNETTGKYELVCSTCGDVLLDDIYVTN